MLLPDGHCQLWDQLLVEMFLKSAVSPNKMVLILLSTFA